MTLNDRFLRKNSAIGKMHLQVSLNDATVRAWADRKRNLRLKDEFVLEIPPRAQQSADALAASWKSEIRKWWAITKASNIKAE